MKGHKAWHLSSAMFALAAAILTVAGLFLIACHDDDTITGAQRAIEPPSLARSDGTEIGGNPGFFFLPPIVADPSGDDDFDRDEFNPDLEPFVSICELTGENFLNGYPTAATPCADPTFPFPLLFGFGVSGGVGVYPEEELYKLEWHTDQYELNTGAFYRIFVAVERSSETGMVEDTLGFVDVNPVTAQEMRSAKTGEVFELQDGRTLPIKFRIEDDWLCDPAAESCSVEVVDASEGGTAALEIPNVPQDEWDRVYVPPQPRGFPVEITQQGDTVFVDSVSVVIQPCDAIPLPGAQPTSDCRDIFTEPQLVASLDVPAIVSFCSEVSQPTTRETIYRYDEGGVPTPLPHAEDACDDPVETVGRSEAGGLLNLASDGLKLLRNQIVELLSPSPLVAHAPMFLHRGRGGEEPDLGTLYQVFEPPQTFPGLVSWWTGDGHFRDIYGSEVAYPRNDGLSFADWQSESTGEGVGFESGVFDQAFSFDPGSPDYVRVPTGYGATDRTLTELSIGAWVKLRSLPGEIQRFVTMAPPGTATASIRNNGSPYDPAELQFFMRFVTGCDENGLCHLSVPGILQTGCFHHVVGTYDADGWMRVYLDGFDVGGLFVGDTPLSEQDQGFAISSPDEPLDGLIDDVVVYNRALTIDEVRQIYGGAGPGLCEPPVPVDAELAFNSDRTGDNDIYTIKADGSELVNLTAVPGFADAHAKWSPDGSKIAFHSNRDGDFDIYVMNADGTGLAQLTDNSDVDLYPVWSPDGSRIAFTSDSGHVDPPEGIDPLNLREVYTMNATGGGVTRLTDNLALDHTHSWCGTTIALSSNLDGALQVWALADDGSSRTNLTPGSNGGDAAFSPDCSKIAFDTDRDGDMEIYVMNADGSNPVNLTTNPAADYRPAWSPDGFNIAFASNRGGSGDIHIMRAGGSAPVRVTTDPAGETEPHWRPGTGLIQPPPSGATSTVSVYPSAIQVGETATVTLQARDAQGDDVTTGGATVGFAAQTSALTGQGTIGPVTDNGDGTYSATFTAISSGTPLTIGANIDGETVTTPLPSVTIAFTPVSPEEAEALIAGAFLTWWSGTEGYNPSMALSVAADELTSSWRNFAMEHVSTEPRTAYDNTPAFTYRAFNEIPWYRMYLALSAVYDGLRSFNAVGTGTVDGDRARAFGKFVQGLSHGFLALMFDRAFIFDESVDLSTDVVELQPYEIVMDAAMSYLDEARVLAASAGSFTLPADWINGNPLTSTELVRLIHSYQARFMTQVARTPQERAAVDWSLAISHVDQGIQSDLVVQGDGAYQGWFHSMQYFGSRPVWTRADYKTIGWTELSEASGTGYETWLATPVADRTEFELSVYDERITASGAPQDPGTDFAFRGPSNFRPERGSYHYSLYGHSRYEQYWLDGGVGPITAMKVTEMDLIKAEGLIRTGGNVAEAVALINATRVGRGGLSPATAADQDLMDKLIYEKRIEDFAVCSGCAFFDRRSFGPPAATGPDHHQGLVEWTPLHFPIPGSELERLGLPYYTFGGPTPAPVAAMSTVAGPSGVSAAALYRFDRRMTVAERISFMKEVAASAAAEALQVAEQH